MKTINLLLILTISIGLIIGCGNSHSDTTTGTDASATSCPTGYWVSTSTFDSISVGNTGLIQLDNNGCKTTGYVTCTGGTNFVMELQDKSKAAIDLKQCQDIGTWNCTYSVNSSTITVYCPGAKAGNVFSPAKEYYR